MPSERRQFASEHGLAANSFVSGFGASLVTPTLVDSSLPEMLGGFVVEVTDSAGIVRNARLYVVANGQMNFLMPPDATPGPATLRVLQNGRFVAAEVIEIAAESPGIFSASSSGRGVAAAVFLLAAPGGVRTEGFIFDSNFVPIPLDFGSAGSDLYIFLFGTGLRNTAGEVTVTVDGLPVPFNGPVAQGQFDGLDQLNIGPLPISLAGRGEVGIAVTVDGRQANIVTAAFL